MWRRERNRPRALLNGQFYEEERKLEDMLAADLSENFERKTGGTALSSIGFDSQVGQSEATLVRGKMITYWLDEIGLKKISTMKTT